MQSDSSSHRLCLICFSEIKIEIHRNIYLFAHAFCFTSKLLLMASNTRLQWIWKTVSGLPFSHVVSPCWLLYHMYVKFKAKYLPLKGRKGMFLLQNSSTARPGIHIKHAHDAAYQYRNGTNQSGAQKCFTYLLMLHDLQSLCKWAAAACNGFCSSWEAAVSGKLLIEGEM